MAETVVEKAYHEICHSSNIYKSILSYICAATLPPKSATTYRAPMPRSSALRHDFVTDNKVGKQ
jgi:hypothetical protein